MRECLVSQKVVDTLLAFTRRVFWAIFCDLAVALDRQPHFQAGPHDGDPVAPGHRDPEWVRLDPSVGEQAPVHGQASELAGYRLGLDTHLLQQSVRRRAW